MSKPDMSEPDLPSLDFLDPNHIAHLAYVYHTAGDAERTNKAIGDLAKAEIDAFHRIRASYPLLSSEGIFLAKIVALLISMANHITRSKKTYVHELDVAEREYAAAIGRRARDTWLGFLLKAVWFSVKLALMGALGAIMAHVVSPFVPHVVAQETGHRAPSFGMAVLFMLVTYAVSHKVTEMSRLAVESMRDWRIQEAKLKYDRARLEAFRQSWDALNDAWTGYTGKTYQVSPYFEPIIRDEMSVDVEYIRELRARQKSGLKNAWALTQRAYACCITEIGKNRQRVVSVMARRT